MRSAEPSSAPSCVTSAAQALVALTIGLLELAVAEHLVEAHRPFQGHDQRKQALGGAGGLHAFGHQALAVLREPAQLEGGGEQRRDERQRDDGQADQQKCAQAAGARKLHRPL